MAILVTNAVQIARFANALYGIKLGFNTNNAVKEDIHLLGLSSTVNAYYNYSFGSKTPAEVADIMLGNVGLTGNSAAAAFIVGQLSAAGAAQGQAVLNILNVFSNLTGDATFGTAATAWNATVASALVYTASNPEDVAASADTTQTYVLHPGVEVVTRTAGKDIILAPAGSMDAFDITDGGAGWDTLIVDGEDGPWSTQEVTQGTFTHIEKVVLQSFDWTHTVDANNFQGVEQIWFQDVPETTLAASVSNMTNAITLGLMGTQHTAIDVTYKPTATISHVALNAMNGQAVLNVTGADVTTLNLTGSVETTGGLPVDANRQVVGVLLTQPTHTITTVNVQTSESMSLDVSHIETVNKIDASGSTGQVFAIINLADSSSTDTQYGVTYLGSAGNDYLEANLIDLDAEDTLKGHTGDDTLLLHMAGDNERVDHVYTLSTQQYALVNLVDFEQIRFNGQGVTGEDRLALDAAKLTASKIGAEENAIITQLENTDTVIFTNSVSPKAFELMAKRDVIDSTQYATGAGTIHLMSEAKGINVDVAVNDHEFSDFARLVVTGAGNVSMNNTEGYGVELDATGLQGRLSFVAGYNVVDKVALGTGQDEVRLFWSDGGDGLTNALSDYGNMDTMTGFKTGSDKFVVANITPGDAIEYMAYPGDLGVDFAQTVSLALMAAADAGKDVTSFIWAGNTYLVQDVLTGTDTEANAVFDPATDLVAKLTGVVSLNSADFVAYAV